MFALVHSEFSFHSVYSVSAVFTRGFVETHILRFGEVAPVDEWLPAIFATGTLPVINSYGVLTTATLE
jgi:hypothetical protein